MAGPLAEVALDGEVVEARVAPRLPGGPPVAGDRAQVRERHGAVLITGLLPRTTTLERIGTGGRRRVVVANADLLLVVAAVVDPPLRPRLLDRYLVAAWAGGLEAAIVLTKVDLPHDPHEVAEMATIYRQAGYPVVAGVAADPAFATEVRALIGGRLAALAGHSGVGKSTLTTTLTGVHRATGAVSARFGKGRHTTTDPRLVPLPDGGAVIDTAGVRTFFLPQMEPLDLAAAFPEIAAAGAGCRFRGCRHLGDAGCVVEGAVHPERLESYRRLAAAATSGP
ncbi:MAG: ribosome small subunit-dependent GTPase A [Thermoleophilia bacterium]|nr:ribosome small subunit-dependent GTPase A [Thermoleophilia bacterium]